MYDFPVEYICYAFTVLEENVSEHLEVMSRGVNGSPSSFCSISEGVEVWLQKVDLIFLKLFFLGSIYLPYLVSLSCCIT